MEDNLVNAMFLFSFAFSVQVQTTELLIITDLNKFQ